MEIDDLFSRKPIKVPEPNIETDLALPTEVPYMQFGDSMQQAAEREARTLFVGNVSLGTEKKEITRLFKRFGGLEKMWTRSVPVEQDSNLPVRAKVIMKKHSSACKTKSIYLLFKDPNSAMRAVAANGTLLDGRHLHVTMANHQDRDFRSTVFVGNLPFSADEEDLWKHFDGCGTIDYVRIVRDRFTQEGKGFAYVKFKETSAVNSALALGGKLFADRELRISKAKKRFVRERPTAKSVKVGTESESNAREAAEALAAKVSIRDDTYTEAQMNNVFKHQAVVPATRYKKTIKNIRKRSAGKTFERVVKAKTAALQRLNKEYFETDDLLKIRREKRKMKKRFNKSNAKSQSKARRNTKS